MGKGAPNPQPRNGPEHLQVVVIDADADASTELFPGFSVTAGQLRGGVASRRTQSRRSFRISIPAPHVWATWHSLSVPPFSTSVRGVAIAVQAVLSAALRR